MPRVTIASLQQRITALEAQLEGAQIAAANLTAENNALTLDLDRAHKALRTQHIAALSAPTPSVASRNNVQRYTDRNGRVWEKRRDGNRTYTSLAR